MAKRLNGYTKWILITLTIALLLVGWGASWGTTLNKVSSLENHIEMKVDAEVYRLEIGYIKEKLDDIDDKLDMLVKAK